MTSRHRLWSVLLPLAVLVALVAGWKIYVEAADVSRFVLPPPEDVASGTWQVLTDSTTWADFRVTLWEIVAGFGLATIFGVLTGIAVGEVKVLDRAFTPYLVALQVLPKVAFVPLLIVWLGFGPSAKIFIAATFAFFPIMAGTRSGLRSVDPGHRDLIRTLHASRWQRFHLVELRSALPSVLTGMEVGILLATIGAVVAEYLSGSEGLGWLATSYQNQLQIDRLFGVIVLLSALGFIAFAAISALRRIVVPWHPSASDRPPGA